MSINLDRKEILHIASNATVYYQGEKLFKNNFVSNIKSFEKNKESIFEFSVLDGRLKYFPAIKFNNIGDINYYTCTCGHIWKGACKHTVASLLFLVQDVEKIKEEENLLIMPNLLINNLKAEIINNIKNRDKEDLEYFAEKANLEPTIHFIKEEICLSLNIGYNRKYIVKDIFSLIKDIKNNKTISYGKEFKFKHNINSFSEKSKKLVYFIIEEVERQLLLRKHIEGYKYIEDISTENERYLYLTNSSLKNLFELLKNQKISIDIDSDSYENVLVSLHEPDILLELKENDKEIILTADNIIKKIFKIKNEAYIIFENEITKTSVENGDILKIFSDTINKSNKKEIIFPESLKNIFNLVTLNTLKNFDLEFSKLEIENSTKNKFYFELEKGEVVCNIFIEEKNNNINIFENLDQLKEEKNFLKDIIEAYGFEVKNNKFYLKDEDKTYYFYTNGFNDLKKYGEVFITKELEKKSYIPTNPNLNLDIRIEGNILEMDFSLSDYSIEEIYEVMDKYSIKKNYIKLKSGRFINYNEEYFNQTNEILKKLNVSKKDIKNNKINFKKYNAFYIDELLNSYENINITKENTFKKLIEDIKNYKKIDFEVPLQLNDKLRTYQKEGFKWLKTLSYYDLGGVLADEMGLGKTIQIISLLLLEKEEGINKKSLVVCPTSLIYNWAKEIKKFGYSLTSEVIVGNVEKREELLKNTNADILITTFDILKRDVKNFKNFDFNIIVVDEAQNIKNPRTQNARAIKSLKSRCNFALTGTPIENSLVELWSIFDFSLPGYLGNLSNFNKIYSKTIIKENNEEKTLELQNKIRPFLLRRVKKEVLKELPEKIETIIYSEMTEEQRKIYLSYFLETKGELDKFKSKNSISKNKIKILTLITRLRQICCDPSMFIENYSGGSGKLLTALETIESSLESGHRILLFSQFTSMLDILKKELNKKGIKYYYLDGAVSAANRMKMTEEFNAGEKELFLISLKAGGTGLNLTGADIVIHYDPWWNPAIMEQATDRAHRIGQENVVQVINIVAKDSIEEKILELQNKKKELINSILEEGATFINKITDEELESLFILP